MIHEIIPVGMLQCNCSIFGDEASREAVVIDPGDEIERILAILAKHQLRVKAIVITHAHIDHIGGAQKLKAAHRRAGLHELRTIRSYTITSTCRREWLGMEPPEQDRNRRERARRRELKLGPAEFQVLDTPGHTQGSISLWIPAENKLVAGDTLFLDSIGRTDLPGGNSQPDPAFDSRQAAAAGRRRGGDSGARAEHDHRPGTAAQSVLAGPVAIASSVFPKSEGRLTAGAIIETKWLPRRFRW